MALTTSAGSTGNPYLDGILSGVKWNKTAVPVLTYSFPSLAAAYGGLADETDGAFAAVSSQQMVAVRDILGGASGYTPMFRYGSYASVINYAVSYTPSPTNGSVDNAVIRVAQSDAANPTAYAYYPSESALGGDVWFGDAYAGTSADYRFPTPGTYMWATAIHELGHAMGLKHGQSTGGPGNVAIPADRDAMEFTVMTYRSYVGDPLQGGYSNETYGYAQTLMMLDIAALQSLYGANFNTYAGKTVYRWDPLTGEMSISENGAAFVGQGRPGGANAPTSANRVFLTIWDGNGTDTYDLSNYSGGVTVDLRPGQWSITSRSQLAKVDAFSTTPVFAQGNVYNAMQYNGDARSLIENAIGGTGNDRLTGNAAANQLTGGDGNDTLSGAEGNDTLDGGNGADNLDGGTGDDRLTAGAGNDTVAGGDGNDVMLGQGGADVMLGGTGNDSLVGAGGNDTLTGGAGRDTLDGGAGKDLIVFDSLPTTGNADAVPGFSVVDDSFQLVRSGAFTALAAGTLAAAAFWRGTAAHDADDRIVFNSTNGSLWYDADGNGAGAAVQIATLTGVVGTLAATDFLVV